MSASRSRQKRKLEPISLEELAGATGMSGFCSFLTRDASIPVPVLDDLQTGAPETRAPDGTARETTAPASSATETTAPESPAPVAAAIDPPAPAATALDSRYGESTELAPPAPE